MESIGPESERDRSMEDGPRRVLPFPLVAVLDNLRSAFNVGSIFRTSEAARIAGLELCGITPYPPNKQLDHTALGTTHRVPWRHHIETEEAIRDLRSRGHVIWCLEVSEDAESLYRLDAPQPLALVLGHEVAGVSQSIQSRADRIVAIPLHGTKNSLNVATAYGIALFEIIRKWSREET